jgi:hypothetical protein
MRDHHLSNQPQALVITHEPLFRQALSSSLGFRVLPVDALLDGYLMASHILAAPETSYPLMIFVEPASTDPIFPVLSGAVISAALARRMRLREIRPAWMLGLAAKCSPDQAADLQIIGCQHMLSIPFTDESLALLKHMPSQSAPIAYRTRGRSTTGRAIDAFQTMAQHIVEMVAAARPQTYTEEEITQLLRWLTAYPTRALNRAENMVGVERLLCALGGSDAARQTLGMIAQQWQQRHPLHSEILQQFLEGWQRREIVRHFVERGLYEDSRIYQCIHELPRRISEYLHQEQPRSSKQQAKRKIDPHQQPDQQHRQHRAAKIADNLSPGNGARLV